MKSNPLRILETLDRHLEGEFTLHVYGRSALALGYPEAPADAHATMDVDAILPARDVQSIERDESFWRAQELVNQELGDAGLYFTHLFEDRQVILSKDWIHLAVPIERFSFQHLKLRRPSTADLILTKMMRVDPQDRDDIGFLLRQQDVSPGAIRRALAAAVVPDIPEIRAAFESNLEWLDQKLGMAR